ncbi:MAG: hydrogenase nickel incorporation protein HypB [Aureliella sp.]
MHEASLVRNLLEQVQRIGAAQPGMRVGKVEVEFGPLAGVEPPLFESAFRELAPQAFAQPVELQWKEVPLEASCEDCNHRFEVLEFEFRCPQCRSSRLQILRGDSVQLVNVGLAPILVRRDVQAEAKADAASVREHFASRGTLVVNLVSSPGAGKTSLLQATARHWQGHSRMAVLVGDLETDRDAQRLAPLVPVAQLTTGGACHLELPLVLRGWQAMGEPDVDFLFIENVGNLVCPASHDLAEHLRVVMLSVTEGDDKPGKYPKMFRTSRMLLVSKIDLLPHVPFELEAAVRDAEKIQPDMAIVPVSSLTGEGIERWCSLLAAEREKLIGTQG